jgi:hypothetical protein
MHLAVAISLPLPSGKFWPKAGSAEHSKAAATKGRSDLFDIAPPVRETGAIRHRLNNIGGELLFLSSCKLLRTSTEVQ